MTKIIKELNKFSNNINFYKKSFIASDANIAFIVSLGYCSEDPEKNYKIQKKAIDWFIDKEVTDLRHLPPYYEEVYPSIWQNNMLFNMIYSLHITGDLFSSICLEWRVSKDWKKTIKELNIRCETKKSKMNNIFMFSRDYLEIPSFASDKYINKQLKKNKITTNNIKITEQLLEHNINPSEFSRKICKTKVTNWNKY